MEHKQFSVEIKSIDETGVVKAFLATYRTSPDAQNDIILSAKGEGELLSAAV